MMGHIFTSFTARVLPASEAVGRSFRILLFHIINFYHYDLMFLKNFGAHH